jgi:hypothetical protein
MPYDFPPPQPLYPHVPYTADRGSEGPFKRPVDHGYQEFQNRLLLDEYRFPGSQQVRQHPAPLCCFSAKVPSSLDLSAAPSRGWY